MTFTDYLHYYTIGNPVSKAVISPLRSIMFKENKAVAVQQQELIKNTTKAVMPPLWQLTGRNLNFVRLAGLSGAAAVILGAVGSHKLSTAQDKGEAKTIFETANRFHFFHSLALLGVPMARRPAVTGSLMIVGTMLFSGILYYRAFTGDKQYSRFAPIGGSCLILAWLSLLL